ncbi:MAG: efflux RND transporter permease subunit, partial [Phycisphaeraceae bacterium]|nr:efflux RND transporter permease subunit [Phycisphaeraceae bacterium]
MDYIRFAITNPVKVTVAVILQLLFGMISLVQIPVQLVPNVDQPIITVETQWTGRSPQEVERDIIEKQEDKLKSVSNLRKMTSTCSLGKGEITLEFYVGTDKDQAFKEVSDKLREVPEYPEDTDEPVINTGENEPSKAITWMILDSTDPNFDVQSFFHVANDRVKPYLERVDGLAQINIFGGRDREVHIQIDPKKLALRGITFTQLRNAVRLENINSSAGDLPDGRLDVRIRTVGQYETLDELHNTVIAQTAGGPVRIKDVGQAIVTLEKRRSFVRCNGRSAMAINGIRETGANVISVMTDLRQRVEEVNQTILKNYENDKYGLRIRTVYDETIYINSAIDLVQKNLVFGGILAGWILLTFLRTIRPTMIIMLAIPISVVGTFVVMTGFGRNLNVISLAGLAFAVGMVVDNAIVVLENIDRHIALGQPPHKAAYTGTKEVWGAIVASTLTTLAVFIPVLTIQEEAGQLFKDIALAICAAVSLSLIVSVTVIPTASARWMREKKVREKGGYLKHLSKDMFGLVHLVNSTIKRFTDFMHAIMKPTSTRWFARFCIVAFFTLVSLLGAKLLMPAASYLPSGNKNLVFGIMLTPPAYNIKQNQFIGERIEASIAPYWEAQNTSQATKIGPVPNMFTKQPYPQVPAIDRYFYVSFGGTIFMGCSSKDDQLVQPLGSVLSQGMSGIPGSFGFARQASIFGRGIGGSNAISVEISASNLGELRQHALTLYMQLAGKFGFMSVQPSPMNFSLMGPEVRIKPNYVKASELGINMANLATGIQAMVDGTIVGDFRLEDDSVDMLIVRDPKFPLTPETIPNIPIAIVDKKGNHKVIPLSAVTRIIPADAPQQILRIEELRSVSFSVMTPPEIPLEDAYNQIAQIVQDSKDSGAIPKNLEVNLAGTADKLVEVRETMIGKWTGFNTESFKSIGFSRMLIALFITYLLMAALFESFLYPFVIMFSVPLAAIGGLAGLRLIQLMDPTQQLDMLSMLGFVILIGVVVNNAILLVHQSLNFMRGNADAVQGQHQPMPPAMAISQSVRTRIRP